VRPSDENQATSTRPNLMSGSRPGASRNGEDSILAKLERDPARRHGGGSALRTAGYGAGAMVAVALTATLAWLAADNGKPQPMLAQAAEPATPPAAVVAPPEQAQGAAALIDEPLPPPPPLRLLEGPRMAAPPEPPAPSPATVPDKRPAPKAAAAAAGTAARSGPAAAARAERPAPKPRPQATRPAPRPAQRPARAAAQARRTEAPVDSDVALISAVIVHANGHAEAREEEARARD